MIELPSETLLADAASLKGKIVLITGAGSGFGHGTALLAARYGAIVVLADRNTRLVVETSKEIRKAGGTASAPDGPVDVTKPDTVRAAFEHSVREYGRPPDVVYANAGVSGDDYFEKDREVAATASTPAHPRQPRHFTAAVNLNGALTTCSIAQEFWKSHPLQAGHGRKRRLVILSSMGGITSIPGASIYSASKYAMLGYWHSMCQELEAQGDAAGFEIYAVCPFFAKTRIFQPAILLILSGIPLVPVQLIVDVMVHLACRPVSSSSPPGGAVLLPDPGNPTMALPSEYDPLSVEWSQIVNERCAKTDGWQKIAVWKRVWKDIAVNFFGISATGLTFRLALICIIVPFVVIGITRSADRVSARTAAVFGLVLGLAGKAMRASRT